MQPAAFPSTVCGPQGICRAILSQSFLMIFLVICTAHASEYLWIVMLPLSWFAGLSASIRSGKLFPMISFSPMVPVSGCFLGWFPLLRGCPRYLPSAHGIWHSANLLGPSSQGHLFAGSLSLQELNCRGIHRVLMSKLTFMFLLVDSPYQQKCHQNFSRCQRRGS